MFRSLQTMVLICLVATPAAIAQRSTDAVVFPDEAFVTVLVLLVTLLFAAPLVFLLAAPGTAARLLGFGTEAADRRFSISVMRWLSALSLAGVLLAGAAALLIDPCAQLR